MVVGIGETEEIALEAEGEVLMMVAPSAMRLEIMLEASSGDIVRVTGANVVGCAVSVIVTVTGETDARTDVCLG